MSDLRLALRSLLKNPGFSAVVVLTLAIGIGANTAVFSVVDATVLRPLPFADSDRLVAVYATSPRDNRNSMAYANFLDLRSARTIEALAIWKPDFFVLSENGRTEQLSGQRVSASFFDVLRILPVLGRAFTAAEDRRGGRAVAMLGEGAWQRRYSRDPEIIGRAVTLDGHVYTIIGVVPEHVRILSSERSAASDIFLPIGRWEDPVFLRRGSANGTSVIGRLAAGASVADAQAELMALARNLERAYPEMNAGVGVAVLSLTENVVGTLRPVVVALFGAVGCVLLIACANVANLFLVRSTTRQREFGVRLALGAGRGQLLRLVLIESLVLTVLGSALGLLLALSGTHAVLQLLPGTLPPISTVSMSPLVIAFTAAVSLGAAILIGLAPGLAVTRQTIQQSLKTSSAGAISRHSVQRGFIVAQIALTLVLLVGAGLMIQSLVRLWSVNPGFSPDDVLTFVTTFSPTQATSPATIRANYRAVDQRLSALPGVDSASVVIGALPFTGNTAVGFRRDDESEPANPAQRRVATFYAVGPAYFRTMRIPIQRGRGFAPFDDMDHPRVAMVDERLADHIFPNQDPIGRRLRFGGFADAVEIIGIVGHVKHARLDVDEGAGSRPQLYIPYAQLPDFIAPATVSGVNVVVRSSVAPSVLLPSLKHSIAELDPATVVHSERPMTQHVANSLSARSFALSVLSAFAAIALLLSAIGIYGVVSFVTSQRTREMGLRAAVGARPVDIVRLVLREGQTMATLGVVIGLLGAFFAERLLSTMLYEVSTTDPVTMIGVALLLLLVTACACAVPARRAVQVDPARALRSE